MAQIIESINKKLVHDVKKHIHGSFSEQQDQELTTEIKNIVNKIRDDISAIYVKYSELADENVERAEKEAAEQLYHDLLKEFPGISPDILKHIQFEQETDGELNNGCEYHGLYTGDISSTYPEEYENLFTVKYKGKNIFKLNFECFQEHDYDDQKIFFFDPSNISIHINVWIEDQDYTMDYLNEKDMARVCAYIFNVHADYLFRQQIKNNYSKQTEKIEEIIEEIKKSDEKIYDLPLSDYRDILNFHKIFYENIESFS